MCVHKQMSESRRHVDAAGQLRVSYPSQACATTFGAAGGASTMPSFGSSLPRPKSSAAASGPAPPRNSLFPSPQRPENKRALNAAHAHGLGSKQSSICGPFSISPLLLHSFLASIPLNCPCFLPTLSTNSF